MTGITQGSRCTSYRAPGRFPFLFLYSIYDYLQGLCSMHTPQPLTTPEGPRVHVDSLMSYRDEKKHLEHLQQNQQQEGLET
jgi:hypothetical protein